MYVQLVNYKAELQSTATHSGFFIIFKSEIGICVNASRESQNIANNTA